MCELMLPSSPSWYCSTAVDADKRGFLYFAANYNLYVLNIQNTPPKFELHLHAHQQRAVGVSVCKHEGPWSCCTIGEDGKVKLWNLVTKECIGEHTNHKNALTCVQWSPVDRNIIVTSDNKGGIVVWHVDTSEFQYFCPENSHIFALSLSPHKKGLIAVGYKSGSVLIVNTERNGQVVQRLRGHDEEIHGVCWCPELGEEPDWIAEKDDAVASSEEKKNGCLVATSSKDRTIRVWASSSGRALVTLKLPQNSGGGRRERGDDRVGGRVWVGLHWPCNRSGELVSSSFNGDMLLWDLYKPGKQKWQSLSASKHAQSHARVVFNVVTGGADFSTLCTASMDRKIILWDLKTLKAKSNIPTLGGFGYCLATSPVNPGRLAVGSGDSLIRIWNIDNPQNPFDTQVFWQGLKSKVTALCWHPVKEGLLAYGTEDGRVGIYEVFSSRAPHISSTYHRGTVYNVTWGPPIVNHASLPSKTYFVYSCGDGKILQHEPNQLEKEALNVTKYIIQANNIQGKSPGHTEISFKPDMTSLAAGCDDGSIDILNVPDMKKKCFIQVHRKLINVIKWHPEYTADSRELSPYRTWIATGSGESNIHVMDLTNYLVGDSGDAPAVITESKCQLIGHTGRITQLSWSSFTEGMLASVSYDHTVQIWNVKTCEPVANYRGHYGRLMCVQWSELDPDLVYSGGQDNTVQCWRISQQPHTVPPVGNNTSEKKKKFRKKRNNIEEPVAVEGGHNAHTAGVSSHIKNQSLQEIQELLAKKRQELTAAANSAAHDASQHGRDKEEKCDIVSSVGTKSSESETVVVGMTGKQSISSIIEDDDSLEVDTDTEDIEDETSNVSEVVTLVKKDGRERRRKKYKSLLPKSSLKDNRGKVFQHQDCIQLATFLYKGTPDKLGEEMFHIGHFVDRKSTYELINYEVKNHKGQENIEQRTMLEIMKGDLGGVLKEATEKGHLNDWLIGLSPMGSSTYWREMCIQFAKQLEKDGYYHKAMSYMLASNKVMEAIDILIKNSAYKDAVCLARMRLSPTDPKLREIYTRWAGILAKDSNLEVAAKCYLACREPIEAAKCLARRTDLTALKAAALVCVIADEMESAKLYAHRLIQDCYVAYDWLSAQEVIESHGNFRHYSLPVSCHEVLVTELTNMQLLSNILNQATSAHSFPRANNTDNKNKLPTFLVDIEDCDDLCPWEAWLLNGERFCMVIVRLWVEKWNVDLSTSNLVLFYTMLKDMKSEKHGIMQLHQVLVSITYDIVLGILQLLLGDGDLAANHWAVAIATCIDQVQYNLAEGLCRLLLPQGVGRFAKMALQIHALSVTESNSSMEPVRKISFSSLNAIQAQDESSATTTTNRRISCDMELCTPFDSLKAYYCVTVLKHWLSCANNLNVSKDSRNSTPVKRTSHLSPLYKDTEQSGVSASSVTSSSPRSPSFNHRKDNVSKDGVTRGRNLSQEFSPITPGKSGKKSVPDINRSESQNILCEASKSILWDIVANKQKLEDSLVFIQKAIGAMISKHSMDSKNRSSVYSDSNSCVHERTSSLGSLKEPVVSPINLIRAPSGEYLVMNKCEMKNPTMVKKFVEKPQPQSSKAVSIGKASSIRNSSVNEDEEEFEEMNAEEQHHCTAECETVRNCNRHSQFPGELKSINGTDDNDDTDISCKNLTDIEKTEGKGNSSVVVTVSSVVEDVDNAIFTIGPSQGGNEDSMCFGEEDPSSLAAASQIEEPSSVKLSAMALAYSNLPDEWFELPVDMRYSAEFVTLQVLTAEQQSVEAQLEHVNQQLQGCAFPSVMASARDLTNILLLDHAVASPSFQTQEEERDFMRALMSWIDQHKYLSIHTDIINTLEKR